MKAKYLYLSLTMMLLVLLSASCSLKRSNPLEPYDAPPRVTGLSAVGSGPGVQSKYVQLTWARNNIYTDGYYVYMGLAYNSAYKLEAIVGNVPTGTTVTTVITIEAPGFYYFKVSAYKEYPPGRLEGPLSEWALARVDN